MEDITGNLIKIIQKMPKKDRYKLYQVLKKRYPLEKRKNHRVKLNTHAGYTSLECFGKDMIQDISVGGVFLKTMAPLAIGRPITVTIPSADGSHTIKVHGEVVRVTDDGVGIKFTQKG
ncbi:MAG: hypothetical protein C0403_02690 [Desulfobacterium sp.]|nr:hypothetical protein [Desulfobacterium sp.]